VVAVIVAWFAILFTGTYPRSLFDYGRGTVSMGNRVTGHSVALVTDLPASRDRTLFYEQEVQSGRYLVSVHTEPERREATRQILLFKGAIEASPIDAPAVERSGRRVVE
jgi:hypothetical protein